MPACFYMEVQLVERFSFSMINHWSRISFWVLLFAPGVLYLAYTTRCRSFDNLPLAWLALGALATGAVALTYRNLSFTTWGWATAAALIQTSVLSLVLMLGSILPLTMTALGAMDNGGRHWPCNGTIPVGSASVPALSV
ncbi:hypothetical protein [Rugamonas aquatica]|uniref:Uncharacterized protein n=1 Tax=Rugamonas aquatica TaxID=2743357 RepID=A0A6A7N6Q7_9BURK|nr:hypothetical protein [Rugamonas aquatica]MQA40669.1 hypothetical protein [Rugamonas aquatica]